MDRPVQPPHTPNGAAIPIAVEDTGSVPGWPTSVSTELCELSAVEQETIDRALERGAPQWQVAGRDQDGRLVLAATLRAGQRRAHQRRLCLLIIRTDGLHYLQRLIDSSPAAGTSQNPQRANAELALLVVKARSWAESRE